MDEFDIDDFFRNLPPVKQPSYRIYYNLDGRPTSYSVDDLPGNYIEVDVAVYMSGDTNIRIVNGKIVKIKPPVSVAKLIPGDQGVSCHPDNVCIVVDSTQPHKQWSLKHREIY
jgi:hypothetical protein